MIEHLLEAANLTSEEALGSLVGRRSGERIARGCIPSSIESAETLDGVI